MYKQNPSPVTFVYTFCTYGYGIRQKVNDLIVEVETVWIQSIISPNITFLTCFQSLDAKNVHIKADSFVCEGFLLLCTVCKWL